MNATVPAVPPSEVAGVLARFDGCTHREGQGGRARSVPGRRRGPGRRGACPDGGGRPGPGRRQRRLVGGRRGAGAHGPGAARPGVRRAALRHVGRSSAPPGWRWRGPASTCWWRPTRASARPRTRWRVAAAGSADVVVVKVAPLGGVASALRGGAGVRAAGGRVVRAGHVGRHRRRGGARGRAAGPAVRVRARAPSGCSSGTSRAGRCGRSAGLLSAAAARAVVPDRLALCAAPSDRHDWWLDRLSRCYQLLG